MSIVEEAHARHKAFHRAIALRAANVAPKSAPVSMPTSAAKKLAPYKPLDYAYELAWHIEMMDCAVVPESALLPMEPAAEAGSAPRVADIQRAVCDHYGITRNEMLSARRTKVIAEPRQVAVHICRRLSRRSYPEIGRMFGGRDHTTAMHADRKITRLLQSDVYLRASVEMLIEKLGGEFA